MVKYLKENADYAIIPENSKGKQVRVSFYINSDGSIEDVKLVSGVDPVSNFEAIRLIMAMPKWQPAYQDGIPVRVKRTLPLTF